MIETKKVEKTEKPRLFELWDLIVNGDNQEENKNKKEGK